MLLQVLWFCKVTYKVQCYWVIMSNLGCWRVNSVNAIKPFKIVFILHFHWCFCVWHQAITWTTADLLSIGSSKTNAMKLRSECWIFFHVQNVNLSVQSSVWQMMNIYFLSVLEPSHNAPPTDSVDYKKKYTTLKRKLRFLLYVSFAYFCHILLIRSISMFKCQMFYYCL